MFGEKFKLTILLILFFEILSALGHFLSIFNTIGFSIAVFLSIILSIKDLKFGLYFLFAELFIGSFGRLFEVDFFGFSISVRIAIWLSIMGAWLLGSLIGYFKTKKCLNIESLHSNEFKIFIPLFIFIVWGVVNALMTKVSLHNIFNDVNGWLFFSIIFPVLLVAKRSTKKQDFINPMIEIFTASILWICMKTFFLLFVFSHNMLFSMGELYTWVRDTRIGEITNMPNGFVRIFFQSHMFILVATFIFFLILINYIFKRNKQKSNTEYRNKIISLSIIFCLLLSVDLLCQSRSNWVGLIVGLFLCLCVIYSIYGLRKMLNSVGILILSFALSYLLIIFIVKFPLPRPNKSFNTKAIITSRTEIKKEAGASSRFALLPKLMEEIKTRPIAGNGFGSTVTYKSSDPRVLLNNPDGIYTTFATEWGWLDIWFKLGIVGLISYLYILFYIIVTFLKDFKNKNVLEIGFVIGLVSVSCVNFFSPYMNHPLGIGYLILTIALVFNNINQKK